MSLVRSLIDLFATPELAKMFRCCGEEIARLRTSEIPDVRMDQGAACDRRHRVDGGHAVSATAVCLSLRGRNRIEAIGNVQGDGTSAAEGDHQSGDGGDVAGWALPRLRRSLVLGRLVT